MRVTQCLSAGLTCLTLAGSAFAADGYGSIKGQFVLDGEVPASTPLVKPGDNVKDANVCAADAVPDQSLVVDPATKGIANIFIWLPRVDGDIPPQLAKPAEEKVTIDQKGCVFIPHAFVIRTDQTLVMLNADSVAHNVHTFPVRGTAVNVLIGPNNREGVPQAMEKPEILPIPVKCDIHPWMQAYCLVADNPYAVVTNEKGEFEIKDLPAGEQTFRTWQEGAGYLERAWDVKVEAGKVTDLGQIKIPASKLK